MRALTPFPCRCRECGCTAQAWGELVTDWVPGTTGLIPMTTIQDPYECQNCGSEDVNEVDGSSIPSSIELNDLPIG